MITSIHAWTDDEIETLIKGQIALILRRVENGHTERAHEAALHLGEWAARHVPPAKSKRKAARKAGAA